MVYDGILQSSCFSVDSVDNNPAARVQVVETQGLMALGHVLSYL